MPGKIIRQINGVDEEVSFNDKDTAKDFSDGSKVEIKWIPYITYKTKEEVDKEKTP